jgi:CsoR family transcriptional regulator, copper-sensing transcriptional repressor
VARRGEPLGPSLAGRHASARARAVRYTPTQYADFLPTSDARSPVTLPASRSGHRQRGEEPRPYARDSAQILRRLARMEGQVRGIARMIERDEACLDVMQQTAALRAAVDSVTMLVMEDHVHGCLARAASSGDGEAAADEVLEVLRRGMGRPSRSSRASQEP